MLAFLVHKIFTFYLNGVLNCKCPAPGPKGFKARDARRITAAEMKYMRRTAGHTGTDYTTNAQTAKELQITTIFGQITGIREKLDITPK